MLEHKVIRGIFRHNRTEVTGGWRKLDNKELSNLYTSPHGTKIIKLKNRRWVEQEERMREKRNAHRILVRRHERKSLRGRRWFRNGRTIIKWILNKCCGIIWIGSIFLSLETPPANRLL